MYKNKLYGHMIFRIITNPHRSFIFHIIIYLTLFSVEYTAIYCRVRRTRSSVLTPFAPETEPLPSRGSPLHYSCATPVDGQSV